ncbi:hypothetical protein KY290_020567 [Solanum tuberosum]|uniref:Uncharacterized protein n=1 Tax=Solanum tuberosum TaxID=4113 RepID=A0ABQ7V0P5_SOLTU|nr:hypothetical protein KY290_020567 [Solanum tuberosum]
MYADRELLMVKGVLANCREWNRSFGGRRSLNECSKGGIRSKKVERFEGKELSLSSYGSSHPRNYSLQRITSKDIWDSMKKTYQGTARVKRAQLQALRRDFETLQMKEGESIMS